ncbi:MAG: MlaD family protein [Alphaproteobacteria bacterium]|jgi:ABC-type transporter Mla subunit MlaD|nr:MlaD family protein [Alphaproteobacteria bacterium]
MLEFNNRKLNIIIGLVVILIVFIFFAGIYSNSSTDTKTNSYRVSVSNVEGIKIKQDVSIGGYVVGYVSSIGIFQNMPYLVLNIDKNVLLTTDARVQISNASLFSSTKLINIINGIDDEFLTNNSYISDSTLGVDLDKLLNMIEIYLKQKNNG